jgi:surface polysaccharide O-acyltransferase-like enzyme
MVITEKKSYAIQILRGLAIIWVVFGHNVPAGIPQVIFRPILNISVGLFLFLSGMLSDASRWKPWKRIKKVLIPYLIWTVIYVVINYYKTPLQIPKHFIIDFLTAQAAPIMYYIFVYIQLTLLIPLIDKLARSKYKYLGFIISPLEIIIMRLIPLIMGYEMNEYVQVLISVSCLSLFSYYYLGYMLGNGLLKVNISKKILYVSFFIAVALQTAEGYWYYSMGSENSGTQFKLSALLSGCIFSVIAYYYIESEKCKQHKLLYLLGECSFGIYFSHLAIMHVLAKIPYYRSYVIFPFNAIIAVALSLGIVLLVRRILGKFSKYIAF